jgi:hypothetical protein
MITEYALSIDLGQVQNHIALAIVGYDPGEIDHRQRAVGNEHYTIEWLEHYPKGTRYGSLIDSTKRHLQHPKLEGRTKLLLDRGEVGKAVIEQFEDAGMDPYGIQITGGLEPRRINRGWTVPKKDLVYALVAAYSQGRITIYTAPPGSPAADAADKLDKELSSFVMKAKKNSAGVGFEAELSSDQDDIVMAVAMAVWYLREHGQRFEHIAEKANLEWDALKHGL